jgi:hypothetical protein
MGEARPKAITRTVQVNQLPPPRVVAFDNSKRIASTYIEVGATVNGDAIDEIWVSSVGTPFFVIGGIEYSWEELLAILVDGEARKREV